MKADKIGPLGFLANGRLPGKRLLVVSDFLFVTKRKATPADPRSPGSNNPQQKA